MIKLSKIAHKKVRIEVISNKNLILLLFLMGTMGGLTNNAYAQEQPKHYQARPEPHFKPNKGQVTDYEGDQLSEFEYVYQAPGMKLGLKKNGFSYNLYTVEEKGEEHKKVSEATGKPANPDQQPDGPDDDEKTQTTYHYQRVEVAFKGANEDPEIIAEQQIDYYANYYLGYLPEYVTNVYGYQKLTYKDIYDNIDLVLTREKSIAGQEQLKYDIVVHPGGDLSEIKMVYRGMDELSMKDGKLQIVTSQGQITESIPESYWAESKAAAKVQYQVEGNVVSFQANNTKKGQTLVVDPSLKWSTYLGSDKKDIGGGFLTGAGTATDGNGNIFLTGRTNSTNFPTTKGAYQTSFGGRGTKAFISKFKSSGSLSWSTYFGGRRPDYGLGLAISKEGNVYLTGFTGSPDFPTTNGAYQSSGPGFLSKFTSRGSLSWSTCLSGTSFGVTNDGNGNVYVTGEAGSGFPTNSGVYQPSYGGGDKDAFLSKFTSNGSLNWSTYLGGNNSEKGNSITTDGNGDVYLTGEAKSSFPTTSGAYQASFGGANSSIGGDAFLSKFTSSGSLSWSTYLGGSNDDIGRGITTDGSGNVYVTGEAESDFPTTNGAFQTSIDGSFDAFVSSFNSSGSLSWSTYLGGDDGDFGYDITTDDRKNVYVGGYTRSSNFPTTRGAFQPSYSETQDAFVSQFTNNGNLRWSTFLGGESVEYGFGVATYKSSDLFITGATKSDNFPTTDSAYQPSFGGASIVGGIGGDAFLTSFDFPKPNAGFVSDSGCFSTPLRFQDTSSIAGNDTISRYDWQFGDGSTGSGKTVSHVYDSAGTYRVQLIVTTLNNRKDTATKKAIASGPTAGFTVNDANQCRRNNSFQFTNQSTISDGSLTYSWYLGNGDSSSTKDLAYTYKDRGLYEVILTATSQSGCADTSTDTVEVFEVPEPVSIIQASTKPDGRIKLNWQQPPTLVPRSYRIQRAKDDGPFSELATIPAGQRSYTDADVMVNSHTYEYRVKLIDSCGNEGPFGKPHKPIQLKADEGEGDPELEWTAYQGWSIKAYQVQIESLDGPSFEVIPPYRRIMPERLQLTDSLSKLDPGQLCYRIVCLKAGDEEKTIRTTSNVHCIDPKVRLFVPNAFSPNGDQNNDAFRVKGTYIRDLTMSIYNRWGEKVFQGAGMEAGWDGSYQGQKAPVGPYTYLIIAKGADWNFIKRSGTLQLIR